MTQPLLLIENLSYAVNDQTILQNICFTQQPKQKMALMGISGSGKTTLLKIIAGNLQPNNGKLYIEDDKILGPQEQLIPGNKKIAFVPQHQQLHNNYFVKDLLWFDNKLEIEEARKLFSICNIEHLLNKKTNDLSGGEKQRVSICHQLIKKPKLLLLDEPFSNLDLAHKQTLKKVLDDIFLKTDISILLASHDPQDTLSWADEIIVIEKGNIVQKDHPIKIYNEPKNEYIAGLTGTYNVVASTEIQVLLSSFQVQNISQNYLIRPENIIETTAEKAMFVGTVKQINFYGCYYLINILVNNIELQFSCLQHNYELNQQIGMVVEERNVFAI